MSKTEQNTFSSVISVNPYRETYFTGISSFITQTTSPEFSKDQFAISFLNTSDFITAQIAVSKNIPDEDVYDAINSKMYDDLGLDQALEYKLQYIESFETLDEENRYFHAFVVDPLRLTETFLPIVEKIKYIDVIIPLPLLLKTLYSKEIIEHSGAHCFIYFQENDAFVTIYNDKNFIFTKSIKYSFLEMHEKFCELYGERIEYSEFLNFFSNESLKETQSDYKEYFIKLYKELFANINDILTYAKRAFEIEKFERVYIGSQVDTVTKLDEMLEVEINIKTSNFEFDYGLESNGEYIDQFQSLMHLYTTLPDDEKYLCNFTEYHRPPKFIHRDSGKLILTIAASFILAFAYPVTNWVLTYSKEIQRDMKQKEYRDVSNQWSTRKASIDTRKADKQHALKLLDLEKTEYIKKKNTLIKIHEVKVNYPMKAKILTTLTKDLNRFGVRLENIKYTQEGNQKILLFSLVSSKDRKMTKLVEYLTKNHEREFKFSLEEILYDEDARLYFSELKVAIL